MRIFHFKGVVKNIKDNKGFLVTVHYCYIDQFFINSRQWRNAFSFCLLCSTTRYMLKCDERSRALRPNALGAVTFVSIWGRGEVWSVHYYSKHLLTGIWSNACPFHDAALGSSVKMSTPLSIWRLLCANASNIYHTFIKKTLQFHPPTTEMIGTAPMKVCVFKLITFRVKPSELNCMASLQFKQIAFQKGHLIPYLV